MIRSLPLFLFASLLIGAPAAPAFAAARQTVNGPVELRFAWPEGIEATLRGNVVIDKAGERTRGASSSRLTYARIGDARVVRWWDTRTEVKHGERAVQPALDALGEVSMAIEISPDGKYEMVHQREETLGALRAALKRAFEDEAPDAVLDRIAGMTLDGLADKEWDPLVSFWAGASLEPGDWYQMEVRTPSPLAPRVTVPLIVRYRVAETRPCSVLGRSTVCVRLELESTTDLGEGPEQVAEMATGLAREAGVSMPPDVEFRAAKAVRKYTLLAEAATLLPLETSLDGSVRVTVRHARAGRTGEETFRNKQVRTKYEWKKLF